MTRFNLVDEPWIPVLMLDGSPREMGLQEVLVRSHEIQEIFDPSPLITAALYRLLLAILHRNFGPPDEQAWKALWEAGQWDGARLTAYFSAHRHRFDLFHPERPFYQVPKMADVELHPIQRLAQEAASGNNPTLFDHSFVERPEPLPAGRAACYLVAAQAFSIGGGVSKPFNLSDAPLARGYVVMALGKNLFETLALNLMPYAADASSGDLPCWEQDRPAVPDRNGTRERGRLDYLTWQSRRIHLVPEGDPPVVRYCQVQQNLKPREGLLDPYKPYRKEKESGWIPLRLDPARAVWRDAHALLQDAETEKAPEISRWLARLEAMRRRGELQINPVQRLAVLGLATEPGKATAILWRHERLPLPLAYLTDRYLVDALRIGLALAAEVAGVLRSATAYYAKLAIRLQGDDPPDAEKVARHLAPLDDYWSRLEAPFHQLMESLPGNEEGALRTWARHLRRTAVSVFRLAVGQETSARHLRAAAKAERLFYGQMKKALQNFEEVAVDEPAD